MEQLLKITTIPVAFELTVKNARLEYPPTTAEVEISRTEGGGYRMKSRPIKVRIDTFEARNSVIPTTRTSIQQAANKGKAHASDVIARYGQEGQMMIRAKMGDDVMGEIISQRTALPGGDFQLAFLPTTGPNIQWSDPELIIEYQMDKLNFDLKAYNGNFEFIPGDVELSITQQPDIKIEYVGKPIFVPPSAADNFIDIRA